MSNLSPMAFSPRLLEEMATYFKMLSEPVRLRLLSSLCSEGEATVGELVERLGLQQSVVSRHMKLLLESGFVQRKQEGNRLCYYMPDKSLCTLCGLAMEKITARAGQYRDLLAPDSHGEKR